MQKLLEQVWKKACKAQRKSCLKEWSRPSEGELQDAKRIQQAPEPNPEPPYQTEAERIMKFIEFHELDTVQSLKKPLTKEQATWLLSKYPIGAIEDVLLSMENYKGLSKKYKSVKLTANAWLRKRMQDHAASGNQNNIRTQYT